MAKKSKYYFPPKQKPPLQVGNDVRKELMRIAEQHVADREAENISNYTAFTLEALTRLGWTGKTRLNRFLSMLTLVSSEATNADDSVAYAKEIKKRMTDKGVVAFLEELKNDDRPQLEGTQSEK
jgi:hypothetical protein